MDKLIDAHLHITPDLLPHLRGVSCIANADSPEEYHWLCHHSTPEMTISAGIHPWKAAATHWPDMEPILRSCTVIGEIGLDCIWCNTPLSIQRELFHRQLTLAQELHKPVILHTKGMEQEVLHTIRQYPNRYLLHWYSDSHWIEEFLALDCWFTIGPDLYTNPTVQALAKIVPFHRLLLESDGLDGMSCALGQPILPHQYLYTMDIQLRSTALLRGVSPSFLSAQCTEALKAFLA